MKEANPYRMLVVIAALTLVATSCTTLHEPESPVTLAESFSATGEAPPVDAWWTEFDDPALNGLIREALESNLDLRAVWDRLDQAAALARIQGASSWPTLNAQFGITQQEQKAENPATGETDTRGDTVYSAGLVASYEVDLWGRIGSLQDAAAYDLGIATQDVQAAAITLSAEIASTWYQWTEAREQVRLLQQQLETNRDLLVLLESRFQQGQIGASDVLQQRQIVEARRGSISAAEASEVTLSHRLNLLTGTAPGSPLPEPSNELTELPPLPETGVPAELMRRRPDVQRAYLQVRAADARTAAAAADRYPRISITGRLTSSDASVGDLFDSWLASLAGDVVAPLLDGGRRRAEVDRNEAVVSQRVHQYGQSVLEALGEVENALVRERKQTETLASLRVQLDLADQSVELIRRGYAGGNEDFLSVLTATVSYQNLERTVLQAERQLVEFRIALYRALAGGWDMERF